jgi:hypothetical protein
MTAPADLLRQAFEEWCESLRPLTDPGDTMLVKNFAALYEAAMFTTFEAGARWAIEAMVARAEKDSARLVTLADIRALLPPSET